MTTPPPITGVAEIVLSVADLPRMQDFYTRVLGFTLHSEASLEGEAHDPDGAPTISFLTIRHVDTPLDRGGHPQMLVLIDHRRHLNARRRLRGHDVTRSTLNHLAFEVPAEALDAHVAWLTAQDIEVEHAAFPALQAWAIFFRDPEGNVLELICHHPPAAGE